MTEERRTRPRHATISDIPQIASIFTHYATTTELSLVDSPISVVDMVNVLRRCNSSGYPFLCLVWEDEPHIVLGFIYAATEMYRLTKFRGVVVNVMFVNPAMRGVRVFDRLVLPYIKVLVKNPEFKAALSETNFGNQHVRHKHSPAYLIGSQPPSFLRKGGFKFGQYIEIGLEAFSREVFANVLENAGQYFKIHEHL
jgi:hypothetical protein